MEAIVITGKGTFEYKNDLPVPEPGRNEVRIKVLAAGICGTDVHITGGDDSLISMMTPPLILGHEFCGEVDSWGSEVKGFSVGEYVSAEMHEVCRVCRPCREGKYHACVSTKIHGLHCDGSFAEYLVIPAWNVVKLPKSIPVQVGAVMDAFGNAVHTVTKAPIANRTIAVVGYGPIGAMALEAALFAGAAHVFVAEISGKALKRASDRAERAEGKVTVIDAREEDASQQIISLSDGGVDTALDFSGASMGINKCFTIVRHGGEVCLLGIPSQSDLMIHDYGTNLIMKGLTVHAIIGREVFDTWETMISMLESGLDLTSLITGEYPLREFSTGLERFKNGLEQKVILYPGK